MTGLICFGRGKRYNRLEYIHSHARALEGSSGNQGRDRGAR